MIDPEKENRVFKFDPATFRPLPKTQFYQRHLVQPARSLGKHMFFGVMFVYPIILVTIGLEFGGLVFWTSFAASFALIGFLIRKMGYSENFRNYGVSSRKIFGLVGAFLLALGFYMGLITLKLWFIPITVIVLAVGILVVIKKARI